MTTPRSAGVQVIAACLTAFIIAVDNIAIASLLFQGPALERNLSVGLKYVLAGAAVNQLFLSATCEYEVAIAVACAESLPFLIPAVAGIVESMPGESDDAILATVLCALTISSLMAGVIFILLGLFRLSWLLNFVPEAVVKGLYAAVGWLSFTYCFDITTGMSLLPANFAALGTAFYVARWLPAIVLGLVLYIVDDQASDPKMRAAPECTSPLLVAPLFPSRSPPRGPFLLRFGARAHFSPILFSTPASSRHSSSRFSTRWEYRCFSSGLASRKCLSPKPPQIFGSSRHRPTLRSRFTSCTPLCTAISISSPGVRSQVRGA